MGFLGVLRSRENFFKKNHLCLPLLKKKKDGRKWEGLRAQCLTSLLHSYSCLLEGEFSEKGTDTNRETHAGERNAFGFKRTLTTRAGSWGIRTSQQTVGQGVREWAVNEKTESSPGGCLLANSIGCAALSPQSLVWVLDIAADLGIC